ncbi:unnamed protein product [Effrenium voratum]|nr:unnamed protein product [Effrenium voratum]
MRSCGHSRCNCSSQAPTLWQFINEVSLKGLFCVVGLTVILGVTATTIFPTLRSIEDRWGVAGTAVTEVIEAIQSSAAVEVPADTECPICLGCEDSLLGSWRELPCSHRFHEECLLEWIGRKPRCPLCRLDLHSAYAEPSPLAQV